MRYRLVPPTALLLALGCHATPEPVPAAVPRTDAPPQLEHCVRTVSGVSTRGWREVQGDGFSFCVPGYWRGAGERWWSGQSSIEWTKGLPPVTPRELEPLRLTLPPRVELDPRVASRRPGPSSLPYSVYVDGRLARFSVVRTDTILRTSAQWTTANLSFVGQAADARAADEQLAIYRSVRFW